MLPRTGHLPFAICHLLLAICYLLLAIGYPPAGPRDALGPSVVFVCLAPPGRQCSLDKHGFGNTATPPETENA
jgi:hypothetical protein